jgi:hypothetical protein
MFRYVVEPNEHGIACDLIFRATTVAVEEPRQQRRTAEGILLTDHTRLRMGSTTSMRIGPMVVDPAGRLRSHRLRLNPLPKPRYRDDG